MYVGIQGHENRMRVPYERGQKRFTMAGVDSSVVLCCVVRDAAEAAILSPEEAYNRLAILLSSALVLLPLTHLLNLLHTLSHLFSPPSSSSSFPYSLTPAEQRVHAMAATSDLHRLVWPGWTLRV
jgi:hypothetical protein